MQSNYNRLLLVIALLSAPNVDASSETEAVDHALTAAYKQTGMEDMFNKLVDAHVPKELRQEFERYSPIVSALLTQRLDLKWNF